MTIQERMNFAVQLSALHELVKEYSGKTIDNIIMQMEARLGEDVKNKKNN